MAKGFSTLELATIITCASLAINAAAEDSHISLKSFPAHIHHVLKQGGVMNANNYLAEVNRALQQVNNS
jgi:hypothetical protein